MKIYINKINKECFCSYTIFNPDKNGIVDTKQNTCKLDNKLCNCKTCGILTGFNRNNNG